MKPVRIYGADWCEDTRETLRRLDERHVPYEYVDIERDPKAREWVRWVNDGKQKTPTLDIDHRILSVPDPQELDRALDEAAQ